MYLLSRQRNACSRLREGSLRRAPPDGDSLARPAACAEVDRRLVDDVERRGPAAAETNGRLEDDAQQLAVAGGEPRPAHPDADCLPLTDVGPHRTCVVPFPAED